MLTFFILIARPLILAFGLPEMLMITSLGLSMVAILAGRAPVKGVVALGLGLMFGNIGAAPGGGAACGCRPMTCPISSTAFNW